MSERWGDSQRDRDELDAWITREPEGQDACDCLAGYCTARATGFHRGECRDENDEPYRLVTTGWQRTETGKRPVMTRVYECGCTRTQDGAVITVCLDHVEVEQ